MKKLEINQDELKNYKLGNLPPYKYIANPVANHQQDWTVTRVSIIIPAFNAFDTIPQTLMSIAMQENIHEIETIIVDDHSTEGRYDEIAEFFSHFMKIKVIRLEKGLGPGGARQVGFDHAVGEMVTAIDADDCFCRPNAISSVERCMIEGNHDCVVAQFLEQNENGDLHVHNFEMVWVFMHMYRKSFLDKYQIRMNISHSNEDTGFNRLVAGLTTRIWFMGDYSGLYMWRFKNTSITRFNNGMYGGGSGETGWLGNMMWQIDHLKRRYVNSNYILRETMHVMFNCYWFHIQNMYQWPLQSDAEINRMRYFYWNYYVPIKDKIEPDVFKQIYIESANGRNIEQQGVIPKMTIYQFLDMLAEKPYEIRPEDDVDGSEPIHEMYEDTPEDVPVEIMDYTNNIHVFFSNTNNNTNLARMDGMHREIQKEKVAFKDLRTVKNDANYDENGKRILKEYKPSYAKLETEPIVKADSTTVYDSIKTIEDKEEGPECSGCGSCGGSCGGNCSNNTPKKYELLK